MVSLPRVDQGFQCGGAVVVHAGGCGARMGVRTLERQINSFAFERRLHAVTPMEKPPQPERIAPAALDPRDFIKDPYVLECLDLGDRSELRETTLERAIIGRLQEFKLELGKGFAFVGRQYRISTETKHF